MPPTPVLFFLPAVFAAVILLVAGEGAAAGQIAVSKAAADISSCLVSIMLACLRREVVEETTLSHYSLVSQGS